MSQAAPALPELTRRLVAFRDARDWRQFHSLKDLIVSLNIEAAELLELAQWRSAEAFEAEARTGDARESIAQECADVLIYLLLVAERLDIDLADAAARKIELNETRYPVDKARGNARKHSEL